MSKTNKNKFGTKKLKAIADKLRVPIGNMLNLGLGAPANYAVHFESIEWDLHKENNGQPFDPEVIAALPKTAVVLVYAPNKDCAKDWAMNDLTDDNGFLIEGCKVTKIEVV